MEETPKKVKFFHGDAELSGVSIRLQFHKVIV